MSQPPLPIVSTLPSRPTFALPPRPSFSSDRSPRDTSIAVRKLDRSPSPSSAPSRSHIDTYIPQSTPRRQETDRYIPYPSPEPPRRRETDSYRPSRQSPPSYGTSYRHTRHSSDDTRREYSTSRSPEKRPLARQRSPSPPSSREYRRPSVSGRRSLSRSREAPSSEKPAHHDYHKHPSSQDERRETVTRQDETLKRTAPQPASPQAAKKLRLSSSIPTGPRETSPSSFQSPSHSQSIPTGPKANRGPESSAQAPIVSAFRAESSNSTKQHAGDAVINDEMARGGGRGRGKSSGLTRGSTGGHPAPSISNGSSILQPPFYDQNFILASYSKGVPLKPQWAENPKSPLANYIGNSMPIKYIATTGTLNGRKMTRVTVLVDQTRGITGIGDAPVPKDAEKLAALSAILQLQAAGLLDGKMKGSAPQQSTSATPAGNAGGSETAKLTDGSLISYDRARQFMDYYCQRYDFSKPDIEFTQSTGRGKGNKSGAKWEATLKVGGKVIGMGESASKKGAQVKTYLDVTQYLEECDPQLWQDFSGYSEKDPMKDLGLAPHLVFQMSDKVNDDIQAMSDDIRRSTLFTNAPTSGLVTDPQAMPTWSSGRKSHLSEAELQSKSQVLQDRLLDYNTDPKMDQMRKGRDSLPIKMRATDILTKVQLNDVTIVMAATGSGKTTQVPQLLFDDFINRGDGAKCNIICTQPRRLAAMSVAERIADERGQRIGKEVGYQVRFDNKLPESDGSITFCTTGIFLKRMQSALGNGADQEAILQMDKVTHIVVDEVHERDIDTDLSLVVLKRLLADRKARKKPIKVILMSATIDPTLFKEYFLDDRGRAAPVVEVPGRTFPVERHYLNEIIPELESEARSSSGWVFQEKSVSEYLSRELQHDKLAFNPTTGMDLEIPYPLVALTIAYVMNRSDDGHVLVFLPGWDEIKKVANILLDTSGRGLMNTRFTDTSKYSIHYLHSTIPAAEQKEVFNPPPKGVRRIILATNIAETSITIPDVVYVVDSARVKEKRYDPERHMSSLVSAWVGSSNLNQRAGRAGRHREGEYFGLLSENRYNALETHQTVEMMRSDLSNVVMHVKALNLGVVEEVMAAVIEPPEPSRIVAAMETLRMLGAMDSDKNLTSLGRVLLQLPVEAAIGKLCLYGSFFRCLDSALTLAAILTNRDPFLAPVDLKRQADEIKDSWSPTSFRSDPLATWAAYNEWCQYDDAGQYYKGNQFCSANFLAKATLLQIKQVKGSLLQSLDQAGVLSVSAGGNVRRIGRRTEVPRELNENGNSLPLLAALIAMASAPNFALRASEKSCRTAQDKTTFIHSSSVNSRRRETGGPELPSTSFNPAEKRLYAFTEKSRNVPLGSRGGGGAMTYLRNVTRLDPLTYMLFGAYNLIVTRRGLECDGWLPVTGNLYALDDLQRLKALLERCMLRVFEGVGKSLVQGRDARRRDTRGTVHVRKGNSRIDDTEGDGDMEEGEIESGDDEEGYQATKSTRQSGPLLLEEVKELELLTTDVVKVLEAYANEREGGSVVASRPPSRPVSRPVTPGLAGHGPLTGTGNGLGGRGDGAYRPPGRR